METVEIKRITPDPNQPRKLFAADSMKRLKDSIKREGIIQPLVVEKVGDNYLLIDGERRYRAAMELNLKQVPIIVEETRNALDRKLRQFTVQEQHEAWTPVEKAIVLQDLATELGIHISEVCQLLNISRTNAVRYVAFTKLADKESYLKSEIPLDFAVSISQIRSKIKRLSQNELKKEFTKQDEKKLEHRLIQNIKEGSVDSRRDITKLGYAFEKDPKMIEEYMSKVTSTPTSLFLKSGAQGAQHLRNVSFNATYLTRHINQFMTLQDVEVPQVTVNSVKYAAAACKKFIDAFDK